MRWRTGSRETSASRGPKDVFVVGDRLNTFEGGTDGVAGRDAEGREFWQVRVAYVDREQREVPSKGSRLRGEEGEGEQKQAEDSEALSESERTVGAGREGRDCKDSCC